MVIKNNFSNGKTAIKAVLRLAWLRIRWQQRIGYTHWPPIWIFVFFCLCHVCIFICMLELESYFCKAAAARLVVSDVRGQITTHRDGAAGCSIFAIAQWRLEGELFANALVPTASELEQMLQASDNWTLGVCIQYVGVNVSYVQYMTVCCIYSYVHVYSM